MKKVIPVLLIICMTLFSMLAISIGVKLATENPEKSIQSYEILNTKANAGDNLEHSLEKDQIPAKSLFGIYHTLSSSAKYAYGDGSYLEAYDAHSRRKGMEKISLYLHIILGGIILFTGCFQFWIWFRKRFKKLHRVFGIVYCVSAIGLGFFVLTYLSMAGIETTHEEYIGYLGLHILNVTTVIPVFISIYYLYKKEYTKHLGWMALSFGSILTAPTQRISWGILAYLDIGQTHAVSNSIVDTYLFASCYIVGYILFCWNRLSFPLQVKDTIETKPYKRVIVYIFSILAVITVVFHYCFTNGMEDSELAQLVITSAVITQEKSIVYSNSLVPFLYGICNSASLVLGAYLVSVNNLRNKRYWLCFMVCVFVMACIEIFWGYKIGLPTTLHGVGGSYYMFWGIVHLFFVILLLYAAKYKEKEVASFFQEWNGYLWILLFAAAARYWFIYIHAFLKDYIADVYIEKNHVHQFIVALPIAVLSIVALIISIYSSKRNYRLID